MSARVVSVQPFLLVSLRSVAVAALLVFSLSAPARAVSISDLVQLSRAGLSDDVVVALIEADGTVFNLDAPKILALRADGLSERVILAMLKSGARPVPPEAAPVRTEPPMTAAPAEPEVPPLVVVGEPPPPPLTAQEPLTIVVPWVPAFGVPSGRPHVPPARRTLDTYRGFGRFINDGWVDPAPRHR